MTDLLDFTWLIPAFPFAGACFIGFLLLAFNRTMNRLTKPSSFVLIACATFSTIFSFIDFNQNVSGELDINLIPLDLLNISIPLSVDKPALLVALALGLIVCSVLIGSYLSLDRRQGYIRYIVSICFAFSLILLFIFNGQMFHLAYDSIIS